MRLHLLPCKDAVQSCSVMLHPLCVGLPQPYLICNHLQNQPSKCGTTSDYITCEGARTRIHDHMCIVDWPISCMFPVRVGRTTCNRQGCGFYCLTRGAGDVPRGVRKQETGGIARAQRAGEIVSGSWPTSREGREGGRGLGREQAMHARANRREHGVQKGGPGGSLHCRQA